MFKPIIAALYSQVITYLVVLLAVGAVFYLISSYVRSRSASPKQASRANEPTLRSLPLDNKRAAREAVTDGVTPALKNPLVKFNRVPLMNSSERNVYVDLLDVVGDKLRRPDISIHSQVSMIGVLKVEGEWAKANAARNSINAKRFDYVLVDRVGYPLAVIEYNGPGHHDRYAKKRDAAKRFACERAGLPLIVIDDPQTAYDVMDDIRAVL